MAKFTLGTISPSDPRLQGLLIGTFRRPTSPRSESPKEPIPIPDGAMVQVRLAGGTIILIGRKGQPATLKKAK